MEEYLELNKCCFCGKTIIGPGLEQSPVIDNGVACAECNKLSIQRKLMILRQKKEADDE